MFTLVDPYYPYINIFKPAIQERIDYIQIDSSTCLLYSDPVPSSFSADLLDHQDEINSDLEEAGNAEYWKSQIQTHPAR